MNPLSNLGPISASAPGQSVTTGTGKKITFNTKYPFAKLDSTNNVSFQLINILFVHEPPNPNGSSVFYIRTLIYSFAHGYTYVPSTWFLVSVDSFQSAVGSEGVYIAGGGDAPGYKAAVVICTVDATNVNIYIDKYYDTRVTDLGAPNIVGTNLSIRSYVFANDLSGTDVPSRA